MIDFPSQVPRRLLDYPEPGLALSIRGKLGVALSTAYLSEDTFGQSVMGRQILHPCQELDSPNLTSIHSHRDYRS